MKKKKRKKKEKERIKSGHPSKRVFSKLILPPQYIAASLSILRTEGKVAADWSAPQLKTKEEVSVLGKSTFSNWT